MVRLKTALILAGGKGTRFKEKTLEIPKPMIEANGKPLMSHIMDIYNKYGVSNFVVLAGYKNEEISKYYSTKYVQKDENIFSLPNSVTVTILDTGLETMTGGRLRQGIESIDDQDFYLTYGDGIGTIEIDELTDFYDRNNSLVTLTAMRPPARFGSLEIDENLVIKFGEKDNSNEGWINGGFFVVNRGVLEYLIDDDEPFEKTPLETIAKQKCLSAYKHNGFWQPVDTIRELEILESQLNSVEWKNYLSK